MLICEISACASTGCCVRIWAPLMVCFCLDYFDTYSSNMNQYKQPARCNLVIEFIIPKFIEGSTCFERHTAHHQELQTLLCILWFIYPCGDRPLSRPSGNLVPTHPGQRPVTTWVYKPEAANTVWSSWWWVVCHSKHVESSINFGMINSITRLHLVGHFYWFILRCTDPWISNYDTFLFHRGMDLNIPMPCK